MLNHFDFLALIHSIPAEAQLLLRLLIALCGLALIRKTYADARMPASLLYMGMVAHVCLLLDASGAEGQLVLILYRCIIPAAIALLLLLFMGETPIWGSIFPIGAYLLVHSLTGACSNVLLPIAAGLAVLPLLLYTYRIALAQLTMDMQSQDMLGDSAIVQELYARGYRPSAYYQGRRRRSRAQYQLQLHGVETVD